MSEQNSSHHTEHALPSQLTIETSEDFLQSLRTLDTTACTTVVLDAANVTTLTSPGMQLLLSLSRTLEKEGKRLQLNNIPAWAVDIFKLYGLEDQIKSWSTP